MESARYFDTWVISHWNADEVHGFQESQGSIPGLQFVFVPMGLLSSLFWRLPKLAYLGYNLWHRRAFRVAQQLHREVGFDVVHQVNMCGYREPGYLWKLDAPFVWGPVGGTQNYPWRFLSEAGPMGAVAESLRNVLNWLQLRCSLRVRRAAGRASVFLTANSTCQQDFLRALGVGSTVLLETAVERPSDTPREPAPSDAGCASSGRAFSNVARPCRCCSKPWLNFPQT